MKTGYEKPLSFAERRFQLEEIFKIYKGFFFGKRNKEDKIRIKEVRSVRCQTTFLFLISHFLFLILLLHMQHAPV